MAGKVQMPSRPRSDPIDSVYESDDRQLNEETIHGLRRHLSKRNAAKTSRETPAVPMAWPSSASGPNSPATLRKRFSVDEKFSVPENLNFSVPADSIRSGRRRQSRGGMFARKPVNGSSWDFDGVSASSAKQAHNSNRHTWGFENVGGENPSRPPKVPLPQSSPVEPEVFSPAEPFESPTSQVRCGICKSAVAGDLVLPGTSASADPVPTCQDCFADSCFTNGSLPQQPEVDAVIFAVPRTEHNISPPHPATPATGATTWLRSLLGLVPSQELLPPRYEDLDLQAAPTGSIGEESASDGTRTCVVCDERLHLSDYPKTSLTRSCEHENSACNSCVQTWIEAQLTDQSWDKIKCLGCKEIMQYNDVRRHASQPIFERYDQLAARSAINNDQEFIWCKNSRCGSGQLHEGGENMPLFKCKACGFKYCMIHDEPWHEGKSCAAFDREMNGDDPVEEGEDMDEFTRQLVEREGLSPNVLGARGRRNPFQRRRGMSHDRQRQFEASSSRSNREKNSVLEAQMQMDRDAALALHLELGGDADSFYEEDTFWDRRKTPEYSQDDTQLSSRSPASGKNVLRRKWPTRKSDFLANKARPGESSNIGSAWDSQVAADADLAQALQREMEQEENSRRAERANQEQRIRQRREQEQRAAREQSDRDATEARKLHQQMEREEQDRVRAEAERARRQREQEERDRAKAEAERARNDYKRRKDEERQGEQTVKANSKQCPKCHWSIQKVSGCEHMTCTQCRHEFCWLCLGDYNSIRSRGNMAHNRGCAHRV